MVFWGSNFLFKKEPSINYKKEKLFYKLPVKLSIKQLKLHINFFVFTNINVFHLLKIIPSKVIVVFYFDVCDYSKLTQEFKGQILDFNCFDIKT